MVQRRWMEMERPCLIFGILVILLSRISTGQDDGDQDDMKESIKVIKALDKACQFTKEKIGWKCDNGDCIQLKNVCDGSGFQCYPNDDDEVAGCNLFQDTQCKSWNAKKYVKCPKVDRCVLDLKECDNDLITIDTGNSSDGEKENVWRFSCRNGKSIPNTQICDGIIDCEEDGSDEIDGCNLFPDTGCKSWNSQKYVKCQTNDTDICTLPELQDEKCRYCNLDESTNQTEWRCNSGRCIDITKVGDGIPDCSDGSDETSGTVKWWMLMIAVLVLSGLAIFTSFATRVVADQTNLLHCAWCQNTKTVKSKMNLSNLMKREHETKKARFQRVNSVEPETEAPDGVVLAFPPEAAGDFFRESAETKTEKVEKEIHQLPMRLINLLEKPENWKGRSLIVKDDAKELYSKVHRDPFLYKNLYEYLVFRYASPDRLNRISVQLKEWEMDFHNNDRNEVDKCWRLHLGSSDILKTILTSIESADGDAGTIHQIYNRYFEIESLFTKMQ